jgi:glycosyltransferase involved in cell wall biosynthesis
MKEPPKVSVGMPVFNGDRFIAETIDSILAQTFGDFELIISDNASTDGTEKICRQYADDDGRIRYVRNRENLGAAYNYNQTFHLSSGDYFKWACHDDLLRPEFLERCVEVLDRDPSAVLVYTDWAPIDETGGGSIPALASRLAGSGRTDAVHVPDGAQTSQRDLRVVPLGRLARHRSLSSDARRRPHHDCRD